MVTALSRAMPLLVAPKELVTSVVRQRG